MAGFVSKRKKMAAVRLEQAQRFILAKNYFGVMGTLKGDCSNIIASCSARVGRFYVTPYTLSVGSTVHRKFKLFENVHLYYKRVIPVSFMDLACFSSVRVPTRVRAWKRKLPISFPRTSRTHFENRFFYILYIISSMMHTF